MVFARKWCCCEIFKGGEVVAKATVVAFVNGAGMEVLLTVVSGENVMFLLDSHKDVGGDRRMVCRCVELPWLVREEEELAVAGDVTDDGRAAAAAAAMEKMAELCFHGGASAN
ncbi:hypothetical protein DEO72_LG8g2545 [Vigna unguiculata]|uniref:Uncharacterized protein n=1 Tax=Vigna unguiculata TaxID=3917 RepID=A0A4D6MWK4_VIGUN|nr:hypothetical protein DEO72_LG8g2545 [Vigna unguiculata]